MHILFQHSLNIMFFSLSFVFFNTFNCDTKPRRNIDRLEKGLSMDYSDSGWGLIPKYKKRPELILEAFESGHVLY